MVVLVIAVVVVVLLVVKRIRDFCCKHQNVPFIDQSLSRHLAAVVIAGSVVGFFSPQQLSILRLVRHQLLCLLD